MNKIDAEVHALPQGIALNKDEALIKIWFYESNRTMLKDGKDKVVVRLPTSFPIPYGFQLKCGTIDQATFECLERKDSSNYLVLQVKTLQTHDAFLEKTELKK